MYANMASSEIVKLIENQETLQIRLDFLEAEEDKYNERLHHIEKEAEQLRNLLRDFETCTIYNGAPIYIEKRVINHFTYGHPGKGVIVLLYYLGDQCVNMPFVSLISKDDEPWEISVIQGYDSSDADVASGKGSPKKLNPVYTVNQTFNNYNDAEVLAKKILVKEIAFDELDIRERNEPGERTMKKKKRKTKPSVTKIDESIDIQEVAKTIKNMLDRMTKLRKEQSEK